MKREEIRKLVGGYAAGILTEEERRELFAAALEHQDLFDELMREEPLRELLADPLSRAELRQVLEKPDPRRRMWWWAVPATAALVTAAFALMMVRPLAQHEPLQMAKAREGQEAPAAVPPPVAPPVAPSARAKAAPPKRKEAREARTEQAPPRPEIETGAVALAQPPAFAEKAADAVQAPSRAPAVTSFGPPVVVLESGAGARDAFYGIPATTQSMFRRAASQGTPRLGLRYTRADGVLTVETNSAARLRVFDGEREIFNSSMLPRARETVAAPAGRPLRIVLERPGAEPSKAARVIQEHDADERATFVVAEPEAASMTVNVP